MTGRATGLLVIMGFLDLASYAIFNLGFAACGSALATVVLAASGQIITAVVSVTSLHRRLSVQHLIAIAVVTVGLMVRSLDNLQLPAALGNTYQASSGSAGGAGHVSGAGQSGYAVLFGAACIVVSALLFSILGCLYEVLMNDDEEGHRVSQAKVRTCGHGSGFALQQASTCTILLVLPSCCQEFIYTTSSSQTLLFDTLDLFAHLQATYIITGVSLCGTCSYQLLYTLPHWHQLVVIPVTASPHSGRSILASHVGYGLVTAVHNNVQVGHTYVVLDACLAMSVLCLIVWPMMMHVIYRQIHVAEMCLERACSMSKQCARDLLEPSCTSDAMLMPLTGACNITYVSVYGPTCLSTMYFPTGT